MNHTNEVQHQLGKLELSSSSMLKVNKQQKQQLEDDDDNQEEEEEEEEKKKRELEETSAVTRFSSSSRIRMNQTMSHCHRSARGQHCFTIALAVAIIYYCLCLQQHSRQQVVMALIQVPNRHTVASIPGDLVMGILVPVHERPSSKQAQTRTCGSVREQYGIQRVEAAFRTIDSINADPNILPNITLGIEIRDTCWHSPIALEQSIEFIRDAMAASELTQGKGAAASTGGGSTLSTMTQQQQQLQVQVQQQTSEQQLNGSINALCSPLLMRQQQSTAATVKKVKNIVGVLGPASSTDTVQVQNLLQLFNMPQVGYSATSRDLSNKNFFKYFLRVVPSDKLQAQVMIDLMLAHNWTYVTVAYTEGSYGSSLMNAFREHAQDKGICFATLESMPPNADDAKFDELIDAIQKHPNARVVICMCEGRTVGKLFAGFKRRNITNEYLVVGSDGWSDRFDVVEKQEKYALGGISIRIHSAYVNDFDDYYFNLNPFTNFRNPWFAEFWETRFQCNLELTQSLSANNNKLQQQTNSVLMQQRPFVRPPGAKVYNRTCTGRESLRNNHKQDAKMAFVQKSIITMALGLDAMQRSICSPNKPGLCPEMLPVNGSILLQHLMNVKFSFLNEEVYFDDFGDPPGKYEILNFQRRRPMHATYGDSSSDHHQLASGAAGSAAGSLNNDTEEEDDDDDHLNRQETYSMDSVNKKQLNPMYDSYSTLKVFRPTKSGTGGEQFEVVSPEQAQRLRRSGGGGGGRRSSRKYVMHQRASAPSSTHNGEHLPASGYSSSNGYEYVQVGSWKSSDGLSLFGQIHWPSSWNAHKVDYDSTPDTTEQQNHVNALPKSVCSLPCASGHAKKIQSDSVKCCWVCVPCRSNEYLFNEFKCKACDKGWWPNLMRTGCDQIPIQYFDWRSMEALIAISIALVGLILTLATAIVFIKHNNTPVVKSSTRELSYMILFAMIICYLTTFFLVAKPSRATCFASRILPGFAFAMMYGALLTKTNRIARILAGSKKKIITRRLRFMSGTSQVAITWIIILIECSIIVFMMIREPPNKMHDYSTDERVVLVCNTTTMGIIAPLGFDFFLIAMCTLYAFKTRNVPENFNEAKFIGFTMYTTLVIWIAFVVIYLSSEHKVTTLCLCISFSALFALFLLFFPRCYIIIFKPIKNNRSYFTTIKNVRCHIGYQIGSAGAAAAAAAAAATGAGGASSTASHGSTGGGVNTMKGIYSITGSSGYHVAHQHQQPPLSSTSSSTTASNGLASLNRHTTTNHHQMKSCCDHQHYAHSGCEQDAPESHQYHHHHHQRPADQVQQQEQWLVGQTSTSRPSAHFDSSRVSCSIGKKEGVSASGASFRSLEVGLGYSNRSAALISGGRHPRGQSHSLACCGSAAAAAAADTSEHHQKLSFSSRLQQNTENQNNNFKQQPRQRGESASVIQQQQPTTETAAGSSSKQRLLLHNSIMCTFWALFERRSRRKEFDKATSIQQHLRAIRHAEDLDRQTHFRRSQVQRLVQRFDSSSQLMAGGRGSANLEVSHHDHHQQQHHLHHHHHHHDHHLNHQRHLIFNQVHQHYYGAAATDCLPGTSLAAAAAVEPNQQQQQLHAWLMINAPCKEGHRLLVALAHLLGVEQVWHLAELVRGAQDIVVGQRQQHQQQVAKESAGELLVSTFPSSSHSQQTQYGTAEDYDEHDDQLVTKQSSAITSTTEQSKPPDLEAPPPLATTSTTTTTSRAHARHHSLLNGPIGCCCCGCCCCCETIEASGDTQDTRFTPLIDPTLAGLMLDSLARAIRHASQEWNINTNVNGFSGDDDDKRRSENFVSESAGTTAAVEMTAAHMSERRANLQTQENAPALPTLAAQAAVGIYEMEKVDIGAAACISSAAGKKGSLFVTSEPEASEPMTNLLRSRTSGTTTTTTNLSGCQRQASSSQCRMTLKDKSRASKFLSGDGDDSDEDKDEFLDTKTLTTDTSDNRNEAGWSGKVMEEKKNNNNNPMMAPGERPLFHTSSYSDDDDVENNETEHEKPSAWSVSRAAAAAYNRHERELSPTAQDPIKRALDSIMGCGGIREAAAAARQRNVATAAAALSAAAGLRRKNKVAPTSAEESIWFTSRELLERESVVVVPAAVGGVSLELVATRQHTNEKTRNQTEGAGAAAGAAVTQPPIMKRAARIHDDDEDDDDSKMTPRCAGGGDSDEVTGASDPSAARKLDAELAENWSKFHRKEEEFTAAAAHSIKGRQQQEREEKAAAKACDVRHGSLKVESLVGGSSSWIGSAPTVIASVGVSSSSENKTFHSQTKRNQKERNHPSNNNNNNHPKYMDTADTDMAESHGSLTALASVCSSSSAAAAAAALAPDQSFTAAAAAANTGSSSSASCVCATIECAECSPLDHRQLGLAGRSGQHHSRRAPGSSTSSSAVAASACPKCRKLESRRARTNGSSQGATTKTTTNTEANMNYDEHHWNKNKDRTTTTTTRAMTTPMTMTMTMTTTTSPLESQQPTSGGGASSQQQPHMSINKEDKQQQQALRCCCPNEAASDTQPPVRSTNTTSDPGGQSHGSCTRTLTKLTEPNKKNERDEGQAEEEVRAPYAGKGLVARDYDTNELAEVEQEEPSSTVVCSRSTTATGADCTTAKCVSPSSSSTTTTHYIQPHSSTTSGVVVCTTTTSNNNDNDNGHVESEKHHSQELVAAAAAESTTTSRRSSSNNNNQGHHLSSATEALATNSNDEQKKPPPTYLPAASCSGSGGDDKNHQLKASSSTTTTTLSSSANASSAICGGKLPAAAAAGQAPFQASILVAANSLMSSNMAQQQNDVESANNHSSAQPPSFVDPISKTTTPSPTTTSSSTNSRVVGHLAGERPRSRGARLELELEEEAATSEQNAHGGSKTKRVKPPNTTNAFGVDHHQSAKPQATLGDHNNNKDIIDNENPTKHPHHRRHHRHHHHHHHHQRSGHNMSRMRRNTNSNQKLCGDGDDDEQTRDLEGAARVGNRTRTGQGLRRGGAGAVTSKQQHHRHRSCSPSSSDALPQHSFNCCKVSHTNDVSIGNWTNENKNCCCCCCTNSNANLTREQQSSSRCSRRSACRGQYITCNLKRDGQRSRAQLEPSNHVSSSPGSLDRTTTTTTTTYDHDH